MANWGVVLLAGLPLAAIAAAAVVTLAAIFADAADVVQHVLEELHHHWKAPPSF